MRWTNRPRKDGGCIQLALEQTGRQQQQLLRDVFPPPHQRRKRAKRDRQKFSSFGSIPLLPGVESTRLRQRSTHRDTTCSANDYSQQRYDPTPVLRHHRIPKSSPDCRRSAVPSERRRLAWWWKLDGVLDLGPLGEQRPVEAEGSATSALGQDDELTLKRPDWPLCCRA